MKSGYKAISPQKATFSKKKLSSVEEDEANTDQEDNDSELDANEIELGEEESQLGEDEDRELDEEESQLSEDEDRELAEDENDYSYALDNPTEEKSITLSNSDRNAAAEKKTFISVKKIRGKELFQNLLQILDDKNILLKSDRNQYKNEIKDGFLRSILLSMSGFGNDMYEDAKQPSFQDQLASAVSGFPTEARVSRHLDAEKADLNSSQLIELKQLISKAVDKLADEKKAGKNSLENKPSYWWQYMPVVYTVRTIAGMCNSIGKYMGIVSPSSADLFLESAKYAQKLKNEFEKDQRERNEINRSEGRDGPLGDLISRGRKLMAQDERGVLQLQAEVTAHNQKSEYEDRNVFQVTKEKKMVKVDQKYDPKKKKIVGVYEEQDIPILHVGTKVAKKAGGLEKLQAAFRGNRERKHLLSENSFEDGAYVKLQEQFRVNSLNSQEWQATHETLEELKELTQADPKITKYMQELENFLIPTGPKLSIDELAKAINQEAINKTLIKINNSINDKIEWNDLGESKESELFSNLSDQIGSYIEKVQNRAKISKGMQDGLAELKKESVGADEDVQKYIKAVEKALFSKGISFSKAPVVGDINADKVTEAMDDLKEIIERDPNMRKLAKRFNNFNEKIADYLEDMKSRSEEISQAMQKEAVQISGNKETLKDYWQQRVTERKANNKGRE